MIALKGDDNYNDHDNIINGWWFCEVKENRDTLYDLHCTVGYRLLKSVFSQNLLE